MKTNIQIYIGKLCRRLWREQGDDLDGNHYIISRSDGLTADIEPLIRWGSKHTSVPLDKIEILDSFDIKARLIPTYCAILEQVCEKAGLTVSCTFSSGAPSNVQGNNEIKKTQKIQEKN
jgi:hypothetical protein